MFTGCGTALVTPFRHDLSLDEETLRKLVRRQIEAGIDFLVPCGTTGENPTLTREEHLRVVEITLEEAGVGNAAEVQTALSATQVERLGAQKPLTQERLQQSVAY